MATLNRILPYSADVFFRLFERYNAAIWPAQIAAIALALLVVLLILKPRPGSDRAVTAFLAAFWLWTGIAYHILFFTTIYWAAWAFGALFVCQVLLLLWSGVLRGGLQFRFTPTLHGWIGLALVAYALAGYPLAGWLAGHGGTAKFGVAPAPTVIFTLGVLLLAEPRVPLRLMAIPALWALIGGLMALPLPIFEDLSLPLAAIVGLALAIRKNRGAASRFEANRGKA